MTEQAMIDGYTVAMIGDAAQCCLSILCKEDTDLDGEFIAYDLDDRCMIRVAGWMFDWSEA